MSNAMNHPYADGTSHAPQILGPVSHPDSKIQQQQQQQQHMSGAHGDVYGATAHAIATGPAARHEGQPTSVDPAPRPLPKIGETRCYWSLLSAGLDFIYLDPVLQYHLEEQASGLVGRSLLDFVHPEERQSAEYDLGSVLDNKTMHGSVTRVRYSRLSRIRYDLGHRTMQSPWEQADRIALDPHYMAVDIVINWAADNLVLCFIHAVADLSPEDNDEQHKSQWTNWCGTPYMSMQQIELLYQRLLVCVPLNGGVSSRVFQILSNDNKALMMTWPPDQGQGRDYAKLVEDVNIHSGDHGGDGAKTSCTRRYKACQLNSMGEIESIIVPHGTIIFACHKQQQPYYDQSDNGYPTPPPYPTSAPPYNNGYPPQTQAGYPAQHWPDASDPSYPHQQQNWNGQQQYMDSSQAYPRADASPDGPEYGYPASAPSASPSAGASGGDVVPPSRRRTSPVVSSTGTIKDSAGASGRNSASRPAGIQKCTSCKTTQSPEWRKGPSGKKELCNACGLRYARSRAKKEGTGSAANRKRKDKSSAPLTLSTKTNSSLKRDSGSPSPTDRPARRQRLEDASQSGGSVSDTEQKAKATPSPSPPESFVHYAHPNGAHQRNAQLGVGPSHYPNAHMSTARMDSASYRGSTAGTGTSYERERDLPMPPTPVSPDGRMSSARSMLMLQQ